MKMFMENFYYLRHDKEHTCSIFTKKENEKQYIYTIKKNDKIFYEKNCTVAGTIENTALLRICACVGVSGHTHS
jgi:hypothetical protein